MEKPDSRQAALLLLRAIGERGTRRGKELTRARLSRVTLKHLWNRENLSEAWLTEVNDWLLSADWTLLQAGTTFGIVKKSVVENWPRVAWQHLEDVLEQVRGGKFDFSELEYLFEPNRPSTPDQKRRGRPRKRQAKVKE